MDRRRFLTTALTAATGFAIGRDRAGAVVAHARKPTVAAQKARARAKAEAQAQAKAYAHVYLLRGIFGVSTGLDVLAEKLKRLGIYATVHGHLEASALAAQAAADYKSGKERTIILIGHSLGGAAVLSMAADLGQAGVPVALVVPIDPVGSTTVPPNVRRVVNLYISDGLGSAVVASAGFHGSLTNIDYAGRPEGSHMTLQSADSIHQQIIGYVLSAL